MKNKWPYWWGINWPLLLRHPLCCFKAPRVKPPTRADAVRQAVKDLNRAGLRIRELGCSPMTACDIIDKEMVITSIFQKPLEEGQQIPKCSLTLCGIPVVQEVTNGEVAKRNA
jgi:hypothetical protein